MEWKDIVLETIRLQLQVVAQAIVPRLQEYKEVCRRLYRFDYTGFLLEETASLDLTPYLAPSSQPYLNPLIGNEKEKVVPLRLGVNPERPESPFWLQVQHGKSGLRFYGRKDPGGFLPEVEDREIAAILAEATGFHPHRVAALLEGLYNLRTRVEREISSRIRVLESGEEYRRAVEKVVQALQQGTEGLAHYLERYALSPNPSPLLREAFTFPLEPFLPKGKGYPGSKIRTIRIVPEGLEFTKNRRGGRTKVEVKERGSSLAWLEAVLWNLPDPAVYGQLLEALEAFTARVEGILAEAKALSQGQNLQEILLRTSHRLEESVKGLAGLIRVYPFAREFLLQKLLVLELGISPDPPWIIDAETVAVDFQVETPLAYCDSMGGWLIATGREITHLSNLSEGEARQAVQGLVELTAILGQIHREVQEKVEALLKGKEAQYVQEVLLAAKIENL